MVLGASYKAAVFEKRVRRRLRLGLQIDHVFEEEPLGTGGGIANIGVKLRQQHTAVVFNGDVLPGWTSLRSRVPLRPRRWGDAASGPRPTQPLVAHR